MQQGQKPVKKPSSNKEKTTNVANKDLLTNQQETLNQIERQITLISKKLKQMNEKKWSGKQSQWGNLKADINEMLSVVRQNEIKRVFDRKFEEELRLLNDFHMKRYQQSMFRLCFLCCPYWILRKLKYYKHIDEKFEISVSQVQKTPRQIYFYIHLVYIKLFILLVTISEVGKAKDDEKSEDKYKNPKKLENNKENQEQQELSMSQENLSHQNHNKIRSTQFQQRLKALQTKLQEIKETDWKDIMNIEEWSSHSYIGFIQINTDAPIETFLEFKDCKLKTGYLFQQISSSSFDLRTCLVRKSKSTSKSYQYVVDSLHHDSQDFQLRFWLADDENTVQNNKMIQNYILLAMRIGVKEKLSRMVNLEYKQKESHWIIHNYVHINIKSNPHSQVHQQENKNQSFENSSFQSVSQAESISQEKFWWLKYGQALIEAIVEVAKLKKMQSRNGSPSSKKNSGKKVNSQLSENKIKNNQAQKNSNQNNESKTPKQNNHKKFKNKKKSSKQNNSNNENIQTNIRLMTMNDLNYNHRAQEI